MTGCVGPREGKWSFFSLSRRLFVFGCLKPMLPFFHLTIDINITQIFTIKRELVVSVRQKTVWYVKKNLLNENWWCPYVKKPCGTSKKTVLVALPVLVREKKPERAYPRKSGKPAN
jgi:hypothetical protein